MPTRATGCKKDNSWRNWIRWNCGPGKCAAQAAKNRAQRELVRAQADLGKAQANLGLARSNYQRDLEVFKPGYISQAAFDTTKAQLKVAESEVNASRPPSPPCRRQ